MTCLTEVPTDVPSPTSPARAWGLGVNGVNGADLWMDSFDSLLLFFFVKGLHILQYMCVFSEMLSYDHFLDMADVFKMNSDSAHIQGHYNCKCWIGLASCIRNSSHQRHAYNLNGISGPQS